MLPQLYEYAPILLQHFEGPIRTPLMTSLQRNILLFLVLGLVILIQGNSITVLSSALSLSKILETYSFIQTANVLTTLPVLSTAS